MAVNKCEQLKDPTGGCNIDIIWLSKQENRIGRFFATKGNNEEHWAWWVFPSYSDNKLYKQQFDFKDDSEIYKDISKNKEYLQAYTKVLGFITEEMRAGAIDNKTDLKKAIYCYRRIYQAVEKELNNDNNNDIRTAREEFLGMMHYFADIFSRRSKESTSSYKNDIFVDKNQDWTNDDRNNITFYRNTIVNDNNEYYKKFLKNSIKKMLCSSEDMLTKQIKFKSCHIDGAQYTNEGNTCYLHSAIVCLGHIPLIKEAMDDYLKNHKDDSGTKRYNFIYNLYQYLTTGQKKYMQALVKYTSHQGGQGDAEDAFSKMFNALTGTLDCDILSLLFAYGRDNFLLNGTFNQTSVEARPFYTFRPKTLKEYQDSLKKDQVEHNKFVYHIYEKLQPYMTFVMNKYNSDTYRNVPGLQEDPGAIKPLNMKGFLENNVKLGAGDKGIECIPYGGCTWGGDHWMAKFRKDITKNDEYFVYNDQLFASGGSKSDEMGAPSCIILVNKDFLELVNNGITVGDLIDKKLENLDIEHLLQYYISLSLNKKDAMLQKNNPVAVNDDETEGNNVNDNNDENNNKKNNNNNNYYNDFKQKFNTNKDKNIINNNNNDDWDRPKKTNNTGFWGNGIGAGGGAGGKGGGDDDPNKRVITMPQIKLEEYNNKKHGTEEITTNASNGNDDNQMTTYVGAGGGNKGGDGDGSRKVKKITEIKYEKENEKTGKQKETSSYVLPILSGLAGVGGIVGAIFVSKKEIKIALFVVAGGMVIAGVIMSFAVSTKPKNNKVENNLDNQKQKKVK